MPIPQPRMPIPQQRPPRDAGSNVRSGLTGGRLVGLLGLMLKRGVEQVFGQAGEQVFDGTLPKTFVR